MAVVALRARDRKFNRAGVRRTSDVALRLGLVVGALIIPRFGPLFMSLFLGLAAVVGVIAWTANRPQIAVIGLAVWVPLQLPVLAYLYKLGAPVLVVKYLGYLKEFWAIALVIAAVRVGRKVHIKADLLDWIAGIYLSIATIYLVVPLAAHGVLGGQSFGARLNAWRTDCLFVILLLAIRRLSLDGSVIRKARVGVFVAAAILAGFSAWEVFSSNGFDNFLQNTLDYRNFNHAVYGANQAQASFVKIGDVNNGSYVRAGSLFNDPLQFGFFMVIPLGIALERIAARGRDLLGMIAAAAGTLGIIFSVTRGAVIAGAIAVVLALAFGLSRVAPNRLRLLLSVLLSAALLLPFAGGSSLVARMKDIFHPSSDKADTELHVTRSEEGWKSLLDQPMGRGLGANTQTGLLFRTDNTVTTENSYLETGQELGFLGAGTLLAAIGVLLVRLRKRSRRTGAAAGLAGGAWVAGVGLAIGAFSLQTWYELPVAIVFMTFAGLALADVDGFGRG